MGFMEQDRFAAQWERAKHSCDLDLADMDEAELRAELARIQDYHYQCSLGDRPPAPSAISMYRRRQIEQKLSGRKVVVVQDSISIEVE